MLLSVQQAYDIVMSHATPLAAERVPLLQAVGRILAGPLDAPMALPVFDNAAMDGYAVRTADLAGASPICPVTLPVVADVAAGGEAPPLEPGTVCRIMTGAPLPVGADAVIKQEDVATSARGRRVRFDHPARVGEHVRFAGEDIKLGQRVLEAGRLLDGGAISLLAGLGRSHAAVHAPPRVAVLTTGDELAEPGHRLPPGKIYNSNVYALMALAMEAGAFPTRLPVARDDRRKIRRSLNEALEYDVVITTGGVSEGDFDFMAELIGEVATIHVHGVAQQPGKPFLFATAGEKAIFGLPGNPAAAMICGEVYLRPFLRRKLGHTAFERPWVTATARDPYRKKPGRVAFVRARLEKLGGGYQAFLAGEQGAGALLALAGANALVVCPPTSEGFKPGDAVDAMLLTPAELCQMACRPAAGGSTRSHLAMLASAALG